MKKIERRSACIYNFKVRVSACWAVYVLQIILSNFLQKVWEGRLSVEFSTEFVSISDCHVDVYMYNGYLLITFSHLLILFLHLQMCRHLWPKHVPQRHELNCAVLNSASVQGNKFLTFFRFLFLLSFKILLVLSLCVLINIFFLFELDVGNCTRKIGLKENLISPSQD